MCRVEEPVTCVALVCSVFLLLPCLGALTNSSNDSAQTLTNSTSISTSWREDTTTFMPSDIPVDKTSWCRDRYGLIPPEFFHLWTCGFCVKYVFYNQAIPIRFDLVELLLHIYNATGFVVDRALPEPSNKTEVEKVCLALESAGQACHRWLDCCHAAQACCRRQLTHQFQTLTRAERAGTGVAESSRYCPATWDGLSCWDDTPADRTASRQCPAYIDYASTEELAYKQCEENGTWYIHPESKLEWTDYRGCVQWKVFLVVFWINVVCDCLSLILVLPACFIFLYFRSLRNQPHFRMHTCLLLSFVLTHVAMFVWELTVSEPSLTNNNNGPTVLDQNTVPCRILATVTSYAWMTVFMWMFLEALYLYRLMARAFDPSTSLLPYYLTGFGVPCFFTIIHACIRALNDRFNTGCWFKEAGSYRWIIYLPSYLCLLGNLVLLCKILHVIMTQLQCHPNEPSSFRRGAKAVAMLVPLFGLQAVSVIHNEFRNVAFAAFHALITHSLGSIVAVVFCYTNGEVLTILRNALSVWLTSMGRSHTPPLSSLSTNMNSEVSSRSLVPSSTQAPPTLPQASAGNGEESCLPLATMAEDQTPEADSGNQQLQNSLV